MKLLEPVISRQTMAVFPQLSLYKIRAVDKTPFSLFPLFPTACGNLLKTLFALWTDFFPPFRHFLKLSTEIPPFYYSF